MYKENNYTEGLKKTNKIMRLLEKNLEILRNFYYLVDPKMHKRKLI